MCIRDRIYSIVAVIFVSYICVIMDDNFFKMVFAGIFVLIGLVGVFLFFQLEAETDDRRSIKRYMDSKGKAPVPRSWREQMGKGI